MHTTKTHPIPARDSRIETWHIEYLPRSRKPSDEQRTKRFAVLNLRSCSPRLFEREADFLDEQIRLSAIPGMRWLAFRFDDATRNYMLVSSSEP